MLKSCGTDGLLNSSAQILGDYAGGIDFYAWQARYNIGVNNANEPGFIQANLANE
jgi:hypothetical protein